MRRVGDHHLGRRDRSQGVQDAPSSSGPASTTAQPVEILATVAPGGRAASKARPRGRPPWPGGDVGDRDPVADRRPLGRVVAVRGRDLQPDSSTNTAPRRDASRAAGDRRTAALTIAPARLEGRRRGRGGPCPSRGCRRTGSRTGARPPPIPRAPRQTDDGAGRRAAARRGHAADPAFAVHHGRALGRQPVAVGDEADQPFLGPGLPQVAERAEPRKSALSSFTIHPRPAS